MGKSETVGEVKTICGIFCYLIKNHTWTEHYTMQTMHKEFWN